MTRPEHITWQIREVLQTLLRGDCRSDYPQPRGSFLPPPPIRANFAFDVASARV